jgi:N-methylhydantoinase A/oxoprolinase/acetone carboxylase beta subunit
MTLRLGVDIGGTFTDFALFDETSGGITVHKQLPTPHDPAESETAIRR